MKLDPPYTLVVNIYQNPIKITMTTEKISIICHESLLLDKLISILILYMK